LSQADGVCSASDHSSPRTSQAQDQEHPPNPNPTRKDSAVLWFRRTPCFAWGSALWPLDCSAGTLVKSLPGA